MHKPTLGQKIRDRQGKRIANNPFTREPDPGLRLGIARGGRGGYGPSNAASFRAAMRGGGSEMPTLSFEERTAMFG